MLGCLALLMFGMKSMSEALQKMAGPQLRHAGSLFQLPDHFPTKRARFFQPLHTTNLAGEEGLEPPTDGFGDRYSTNCAIPLLRKTFKRTLPLSTKISYFKISVIRPAPMVRPPSRMAKRCPFSIAIGFPSSIVIPRLSPGITISVPSGNSQTPVTSAVPKLSLELRWCQWFQRR